MALRSSATVWTPWIPVVLWIALIALLGGGGFQHEETSRIIGPLLHWLFPDWSPERIAALHDVIRKLAHPVEYAVLAALAWRARWRTSGSSGPLRLALPALALVAAVAAADEVRQGTLESRTGSVRDFGFDLAGGVAGLLVAPPVLRRLAVARGEHDG